MSVPTTDWMPVALKLKDPVPVLRLPLNPIPNVRVATPFCPAGPAGPAGPWNDPIPIQLSVPVPLLYRIPFELAGNNVGIGLTSTQLRS